MYLHKKPQEIPDDEREMVTRVFDASNYSFARAETLFSHKSATIMFKKLNL